MEKDRIHKSKKEGMPRRYYIQLMSTVIGALAGYALAHPYTMLIYAWAHAHQKGALMGGGVALADLFRTALTTFQPVMFPMALSFVLFGAIVGFLLGIVVDKRRRLYEAERQSERRKVAFETLHQLMVTLSHYLLNADTIIAGTVRHCQKKGGLNEDLLHAFETINEQAHKIEALVRALQKIREIKTVPYTADSTVLMVDVTREMEETLRTSNAEELKG